MALALLLPHLQARAATSAPTPPPVPFDPWALATGWLKPHGAIGLFALGGLAFAGYALSQAQNWEALLRLLGKGRKFPDPPSGPRNETHGSNGPFITGGTFLAGRDQFIGGEHEHHTHLPPPPKPELPESHTPHNLPDLSTPRERFIGRDSQLAILSDLLDFPGSRVFLTGMAGVGKSELALQHAHNNLTRFKGGIVRVDARQGFGGMASQVITFVRGSFPNLLPEEGSQDELLLLCWSQWPTGGLPPKTVLLLLDDLPSDVLGTESEQRLCKGLPSRFCRLITRREPAPNGVTSLDLNVLERADALRLLSFHADGERLLQDRVAAESEAADVLCQEVGDLPLALVLLGARLADQPDLTLADLLKDLRAKGAEATALMQAHPELGAKLGVVESLLISWEPLSVAAKELAVLLSIMAPAVIPWDLVEGCRFEDQKLIEGRAFGDGQAELRKAQLLQRVAKERYQLHPLVRLFVELQGRQPELQLAEGRWRNQFARAVAELSKENFQDVMPLNKQAEVEVYVPHIAKVARCDGYILRDDDLFWPFAILSRLCENQAAFDDALDWHERCLVLCEERLGREHPDTAACLNNLANLLRVTNRLSEAEPRMRRALAAAEANHGTNHPDVARILNNIAGLLMATNRLSEAEQHYLRALHIHESHYGPEHPETAMCLNNLAQLLYSTRRCKEAEPLMRRALAIEEARYGPEHPNVAISLNNLAGLLDVTNRPSEAESFYRHALAIDESSLGPEHPNVALRLYNLAGLLKDTNRLAEAESLILRALAIDEASYGPDHPNVARDLSSLANLLRATNRLFKAEQLYRRALEINESSFGPNHPKVASSLNNLAGLLKNVRRFKKAEPLYRRALAIDEASYGLNHPDVARDLNNLASLLRETKQLSDAEPLHRRALAINEAIYGPYHPDVATDLNNLAMLLLDANRLSEAEPLMRRVLLILLACSLHGHEHSHLQAAVSNYKNVLRSMGLSKQTIKLRLESLSAEALLSRPFDEIPPF